MKYIVTEKIKALGLEKGDVFEELFKMSDEIGKQHSYYARKYKIGAQIIVPHFILSSHPDWFKPVNESDAIGELDSGLFIFDPARKKNYAYVTNVIEDDGRLLVEWARKVTKKLDQLSRDQK